MAGKRGACLVGAKGGLQHAQPVDRLRRRGYTTRKGTPSSGRSRVLRAGPARFKSGSAEVPDDRARKFMHRISSFICRDDLFARREIFSKRRAVFYTRREIYFTRRAICFMHGALFFTRRARSSALEPKRCIDGAIFFTRRVRSSDDGAPGSDDGAPSFDDGALSFDDGALSSDEGAPSFMQSAFFLTRGFRHAGCVMHC